MPGAARGDLVFNRKETARRRDYGNKMKKELSWTTERRALSLLIPHSNNPRVLTAKQHKALKKSLEKFNLAEIPAINTDGTLLAGHQRCRVLMELKGDIVVDVRVPSRTLTKAECEEYLIRSNANTGEWDMEALANHFDWDKLAEWGFENLPALKISEGGLTDEDDVPDAPAAPVSRVGDIWLLDGHRILCGDSTERSNMEKLAGGGSMDMLLTDPPYNVDYTGKTKNALKIKNDKKSDGDFSIFLLQFYKNAFYALKEGSPSYIFHADSEGANFRNAMKEAGFKLAQCLIWVKNSMVMGRQDYHWQHEPILYGWKEGAAHKWYSDRKQTTLWSFDRPTRSTDHPTMKPVNILEYALQNSSKEGDIVLDPFLGSGSTLIACEKTSRKCYGMELDPQYMDVVITRWQNFTGKTAIHEATGQIYSARKIALEREAA